MAYKKIADMDEDRAKTYELEQACKHILFILTYICPPFHVLIYLQLSKHRWLYHESGSYQHLTMQASIHFQATACVICHEQKSIGMGFFYPSTGFSVSLSFHQYSKTGSSITSAIPC